MRRRQLLRATKFPVGGAKSACTASTHRIKANGVPWRDVFHLLSDCGDDTGAVRPKDAREARFMMDDAPPGENIVAIQ